MSWRQVLAAFTYRGGYLIGPDGQKILVDADHHSDKALEIISQSPILIKAFKRIKYNGEPRIPIEFLLRRGWMRVNKVSYTYNGVPCDWVLDVDRQSDIGKNAVIYFLSSVPKASIASIWGLGYSGDVDTVEGWLGNI